MAAWKTVEVLSAPRPVFCQHGVGLGKDGRADQEAISLSSGDSGGF